MPEEAVHQVGAHGREQRPGHPDDGEVVALGAVHVTQQRQATEDTAHRTGRQVATRNEHRQPHDRRDDHGDDQAREPVGHDRPHARRFAGQPTQEGADAVEGAGHHAPTKADPDPTPEVGRDRGQQQRDDGDTDTDPDESGRPGPVDDIVEEGHSAICSAINGATMPTDDRWIPVK